ncbi:MAG: nuclear transport factor 2 family protein [Pseudomonadales bacterium]
MKAGRNQQVIMRYIDAVNDNDKERIQSFFAEDSIFCNLPDEHAVGQEAIWGAISDIHNNAEQVDWQIDNLCEDESGSVLAEGRVRYLVNGEWRECELNGVFEVRGCKITQWH